MKTSAYVICKDEEAVIARCIGSFKNAVDEIIVVDTGSSDRTVEIASSLGASVFCIAWQDDFSHARNYALQKCSGDWIIPLDADEYFSGNDVFNTIKHIKTLESQGQPYDGLTCKLKNIDPASQKEISQMTHLLAFKKTADLCYSRPIHEQLKKGGRELGVLYAEDVTILHTGYVLTREQLQQKTDRNIRLIENCIKNGTSDAADYYHLTQLYMGAGKSAEEIYYTAQEMFRLDEINSSIPSTVAHRKYTLTAAAMQGYGIGFDEIIDLLDQALELFPSHPEVLAARGNAYLYAKRLDYAIVAYEEAISAQRQYKDILSNNFAQKVDEIRATLADLYILCGKPVKALDICFTLLKENKYNSAATLCLLSLLKTEPPEDTVKLLDTLYNRNQKADVGYLVACFSTVRIPLLFIYYEKIWRTVFQTTDASMVAALLSAGNYQSAITSALEYIAVHPNPELASMACAGVILGNAYSEYEFILKRTDADAYSVLETFRKHRANLPITACNCPPEAFIRVFSHIVQSLPEEDAFAYTESIAAITDPQLFQAVVEELLRIRRYGLLEHLYAIRARRYAFDKGQNLYSAGVYAMMQGNLKKAHDYFSESGQCGYYSEEMQQFRRISKGDTILRETVSNFK